jgi:hypothetical protein
VIGSLLYGIMIWVGYWGVYDTAVNRHTFSVYSAWPELTYNYSQISLLSFVTPSPFNLGTRLTTGIIR